MGPGVPSNACTWDIRDIETWQSRRIQHMDRKPKYEPWHIISHIFNSGRGWNSWGYSGYIACTYNISRVHHLHSHISLLIYYYYEALSPLYGTFDIMQHRVSSSSYTALTFASWQREHSRLFSWALEAEEHQPSKNTNTQRRVQIKERVKMKEKAKSILDNRLGHSKVSSWVHWANKTILWRMAPLLGYLLDVLHYLFDYSSRHFQVRFICRDG